MATTTYLLCGVGGQGTITAANLLASVAQECGDDVKQSEIHGMAQRGGSVVTVVRIGDQVGSMVADIGETDFLVSFETIEALRNIQFLKKGGQCLVSDETIKSLPVLVGTASMPDDIQGSLEAVGATVIPATELAIKAGTAKAVNVVLLGALSNFLPYPVDVWERVIAARVPQKFIQTNLDAFAAGRESIKR